MKTSLFARSLYWMPRILLMLMILTSTLVIVEVTIPSTAIAAEVTVTVTEKIPGANCVPEGSGSGVTNRKFKCTVEGGFATVQKMLGGLIKYATFITALVGVLMVVFSGLQYATSAGNTEAQKSAIGRIQNLIA
jgi:hypothetical protein